MSFLGLGLAVALLVYGGVMLTASLLVAPFTDAATRAADPALRARRIASVRLLPAASAAAAVLGLFLPAFYWYEPRQTDEAVSALMFLLAALSAAALGAGLVRGVLSLWATRRLVTRFTATGVPARVPGATVPAYIVDEPFPLVTLAGWRRPRLFVARKVLEQCTPGELAAIAAHEEGHRSRLDPWTRLFLRACPDVLALLPQGRALEHAWAESAEQAADDRAASSGPDRELELASALLRVARLVGAGEPRDLPVPALYHGEGVSARVARLLGPRPVLKPPVRRRSLVSVAAVLGLLPLAAACGLWLHVHRLLEHVVLWLQ